ncbi:MAG: VCBS repeat-containing protein [Planctomycetota bacterium]
MKTGAVIILLNLILLFSFESAAQEPDSKAISGKTCFNEVSVTISDSNCREVSDDSHEIIWINMEETPSKANSAIGDRTRTGVPYDAAPDWENDLRRQVGGLQACDMNGDGLVDVIAGCYHSDSYPPYDDWENLIYYNTGTELEASPSWISNDEVSTGDVQVALINNDPYPDFIAANGGYSMSPSVIYWGSASGPSTTPGWSSQEPGLAWNNYALPFDIDHDGDVDLITANQGNSPSDPYRPIYIFFNNNGTLATIPGWQSDESSIQNFLAFGDYDGDGWEDLAVSKWANFESGIYKNRNGSIHATPVWTTGDTDTDKGVAWADVDSNGWPDLALGHDPTLLYANDQGSLSTAWSSGATYFGHSDIRFCDVDWDGDKDLAEIHFSDGKTHIYLNNNGTLETTPSWTYDSSSVGTAIAFGDINGDQCPDLIVGYSGEPSIVVFYAKSTLSANAYTLPETGGSIDFHLAAGTEKNNRNYLLVGGVTGTEPGYPLPGGKATLPVNFDIFTFSILFPLLNSSVFQDFIGTLDAEGNASARLNAPSLPPGYIGLVMHYAYCLGWPWEFASNAIAITVVP